ncbi:MAG TPA: YbaK/EbsC family protein [Tahibacter sp.]|nr:YbaK/EbsC family protein [Tahibacter sp.]
MSEPRLQQLLHAQKIPFETIHHARTVTAQETAASAHVAGRDLAKTVMVKLDGRLAMVVLSASQRLDLERLREATGSHHVVLAHETEFAPLFPDCETGAMPPFGNLYGMDVFIEHSLSDDDEIAFNAGTHTELIRIPFALFEQLVRPKHLRRVHRISH